MALEHVQKTYDDLGEKDALYAVLSFPETKNNGWDPEVFFARGQKEVDAALDMLEQRGLSVNKARALDFGCGVGRLTQALATHFQQADGVDISASMVERARTFNRHGEQCHYHVNTVPDLSLFSEPCFDLIYSNITLQHIPPEASERYLQEFVRILNPDGLALFQIPSGPHHEPGSLSHRWYQLRSGPLRRFWKRLRGKPPVEIHYVNRVRVQSLIEQAGAEMVDSWQEGPARGKRERWFYLIRKPAA